MTHITTDDVYHLAELSALELSPDEAASLQVSINDIIKYVEHLNDVDTEGIEPTYQVTGLCNVWRDDAVDTSETTREQLLDLAHTVKDSQVKVPKVL